MSKEGIFQQEVRQRYLYIDLYYKNRAKGQLTYLPLKAIGYVPITSQIAIVQQQDIKKGRTIVKKLLIKVLNIAFTKY